MPENTSSSPSAGNVRGALYALAGFAVYASHDAVVKFLGASYSPVQVLFFSVLFSFPVITLVLLRDGAEKNLIPRHPWWMAIRTLATTIVGGSAFYAFASLPLAETYAILFTMPLLITVLSIPMLGERVGIRRGLAAIVGLAGVMVVLDPRSSSLGLGHLAAIAAAVGSALATVIMRKIGSEERSVVLLLYPMMANFVVMGALLPLVYVPMQGTDLGLVTLMALLGSAGGFLVIRAYRHGQAAVVAPMQYSQILWATLFGLLLFDERPGWNVMVGAAIVILSGLYTLWREGQRGSSTRPILRAFFGRQEIGSTAKSPILYKLLNRRGR
jgi:drug/metabolite transporter (DMT)-like permease